MAINRKLSEVIVRFDAAGGVTVEAMTIVTDDDEGTSTGMRKKFNANRVEAAAAALRDEVVAQFAGQGRPVTF